MYSFWPPYMAKQKQDDQLEHTYSSYVRIRDVALKTYLRRWTIGRSGERESGISVLAARHDDVDDMYKMDLTLTYRQLLTCNEINPNQKKKYIHNSVWSRDSRTICIFDPIYREMMEQKLLTLEIITAIILLHENAKAMVHSPEADTDFDIVSGVLQDDTRASC